MDDRSIIIQEIDKIDKAHTFDWQTFTNLYVGIAPFNLKTSQKDDKGAFVTANVNNLVEKRFQDEKLRQEKSLGVVLRGGQKYGWASQAYVMEHKVGIFAHDISKQFAISPTITKRAFIVLFKELILALIESLKITHVGLQPNFMKAHILQLKRIYKEPNGESEIHTALYEIIKQTKNNVGSFKLIARAFGGNSDRHGCTFKTLYDARGITRIPEMFGDNYTEYSSKTKNAIVGYEKIYDGSKKYLRLVASDLPRNRT